MNGIIDSTRIPCSVAHVIGLDEIHKKNLIKQLPRHIMAIDLDNIQQTIYNHKDITKQKLIWSQISNDILVKRKQKKLIGSKRIKTNNLDKEIKKLMYKRNIIRKNIHNTWKDKMLEMIDKIREQHSKQNILYLGYNIFPKDYRVKINIPIPISPNYSKYSNKIIFDVRASNYAANQIKFYLKTYSERIIKGNFPLNLLKKEYLVEKYEKITQFYDKQGYKPVQQDKLMDAILLLDKQVLDLKKISDKNIFVATLFKSGDTIPVNKNMPIEGFLTKQEAINNIRPKIKKNVPIFLYEIKAEQFQMANGKIIATKPINPLNEESFLLTI